MQDTIRFAVTTVSWNDTGAVISQVLYLAKKHDDSMVITTPQTFYGPFSGTSWVSWCQKRTSGLYGAREDQQRQTHWPSGWVPLHPDQPVPTSTIPQAAECWRQRWRCSAEYSSANRETRDLPMHIHQWSHAARSFNIPTTTSRWQIDLGMSYTMWQSQRMDQLWYDQCQSAVYSVGAADASAVVSTGTSISHSRERLILTTICKHSVTYISVP